ncbi:hypothetical protein SCYAM73S_01036 [Streptomyces cyaneofuscatus]
MQSAASAELIPARVAASSWEMSVPSTAAAQANRLALVPSRSRRATSPLPGRRHRAPQLPGRLLDRGQLLVLDLGDQLDGLVRVPAGDGPDLAGGRVVGVFAERRAGQFGGGVRGQRAQGDPGDRALAVGAAFGLAVGDVARVALGHLLRPVRLDDEQRQFAEAGGERGEPGQGFAVRPVAGIVDQQQ